MSDVDALPGGPLWRGAVTWQQTDEGWQPWRLLPQDVPYAHAEGLVYLAKNPAGVRLEVRTDASALVLDLVVHTENPVSLDVMVDGALAERISLDAGRHQVRAALPEGVHDLQVWLPHSAAVVVVGARLEQAEHAEPLAQGPRWTAYGSSITQCFEAHGPSQTWPALVAQQLGLDLTCLGFSGNCQLDPVATRAIAAVPAEVVTLCLGINTYGDQERSHFSERTLPGQVAEVIRSARQAHPQAQLVVITPIISPDRDHTPNAVQLSLSDIRGHVARVAEQLAATDDRLHILDGLTIMGAQDLDVMPDGLHPDGDGYQRMAQRIGTALVGLLTAR